MRSADYSAQRRARFRITCAGEEVRTRQPHERESCAVRAAADGPHEGLDAGLLHGPQGLVDKLRMGFDHLAHVEILVLDRQLQHVVAVLLLQQIDARPEEDLLLLELLGVVVADDVAYRGLLYRAVHGHAVVETFVTLGVLGPLLGREQRLQLARHVDGVDHLGLGIARVDVAALDLDPGACGVEVFILQLALHAAVHRVGEVGTEGLDIEIIDAAAHLLVGREADADLAVAQLGMREQVLRGGHDLRHAGLVVGAEQRRAVGVDERVPLEETQLGELRDLHRELSVEDDVASVVLLDDAGTDILAAHVRRGVHMGDEADDRGVFTPGRRGDRAHHIAVAVHRNLGHAEILHLVAQGFEQHLLLLGRGEGLTLLRRLRVVGDIFQKTFFQIHNLSIFYSITPLFWHGAYVR